MAEITALEKRIKRQVTAREHEFFVVVSPGLQQVCLRELKTLFGKEKTFECVDGGISFTGSVTDCYRANLHLRTASRIIMRLASFTARDFKTLEKKIAQIPWELYLDEACVPEVHATLKKSRLYHSGAVAERFMNALMLRALKKRPDGITPQTLFVRAFNDRFQVSLDSSGDLLYLRGLKQQGGQAPLRETIAAGMLLMAGYNGRQPLIDPMCGSGSFSIEAAMISSGIPSGWFRDFAFMGWPCFREGAWKHLRREAESRIRRSEKAGIFAFDKDSETCRRLDEQVNSAGLGCLISVSEKDFFELEPRDVTETNGLILVNPPYGLRLGTKEDSRQLVQDLYQTFEERYAGWTVGMISPYDAKDISCSFPLDSIPMFHGGLTLFFLRGTVPHSKDMTA